MISPRTALFTLEHARIPGRAMGVVSLVVAASAMSGCHSLWASGARSAPPGDAPPAPPASLRHESLTPSVPEAAPEEPVLEPTPVEPGIQPTLADTRGSLPKSVIAEEMAGAFPAFARCLEEGLRTNPSLRGHLNVNFVIAPDGSVPFARTLDEGTDFPDSQVVDCVLTALRELRFPEPTGGRVVVTYPLRLEPLGAEAAQDGVVSQESPGSG